MTLPGSCCFCSMFSLSSLSSSSLSLIGEQMANRVWFCSRFLPVKVRFFFATLLKVELCCENCFLLFCMQSVIIVMNWVFKLNWIQLNEWNQKKHSFNMQVQNKDLAEVVRFMAGEQFNVRAAKMNCSKWIHLMWSISPSVTQCFSVMTFVPSKQKPSQTERARCGNSC